LVPPAVLVRLDHLELSTDLGHVVALVEQPLAFRELSDYLFGSVTPLFQTVLLAPFRSIWTRITSDSVHGDLPMNTSTSPTEEPVNKRRTCLVPVQWRRRLRRPEKANL
jgi:hypothetical protein